MARPISKSERRMARSRSAKLGWLRRSLREKEDQAEFNAKMKREQFRSIYKAGVDQETKDRLIIDTLCSWADLNKLSAQDGYERLERLASLLAERAVAYRGEASGG